MGDYVITTSVTTDTDDKRSEAFEAMMRFAGSIDSIFPNISVSSYKVDEETLLESGDEYYDEYTMLKVVNAFREAGISDLLAEAAINKMHKVGILFREKA